MAALRRPPPCGRACSRKVGTGFRKRSCSNNKRSSEQDRRQPPAALDGGLVGRPPGVEQLDQLLARAVVVPFAVAAHDFQQLVERFLALSFAVERQRQIEACLMIERIARDFVLERADWADRFRLLRETIGPTAFVCSASSSAARAAATA